MRILISVSALAIVAGCSNVQEISQDLSEGVSAVVYEIAEPEIPAPETAPTVSLRPRLRPEGLMDPKPEPVTFSEAVQSLFAIDTTPDTLDVAYLWLDKNEYRDRSELRAFLGVDPRTTQWCAAFVNSVLEEDAVDSLRSLNHPYPLMARSFLDWGEPVKHRDGEEPKPGDVVIFPRGRASWQGHVGFYVDTVSINGKEYWKILGGNQNNSVTIELYDPARALGVRRIKSVKTAADLPFWRRLIIS